MPEKPIHFLQPSKPKSPCGVRHDSEAEFTIDLITVTCPVCRAWIDREFGTLEELRKL